MPSSEGEWESSDDESSGGYEARSSNGCGDASSSDASSSDVSSSDVSSGDVSDEGAQVGAPGAGRKYGLVHGPTPNYRGTGYVEELLDYHDEHDDWAWAPGDVLKLKDWRLDIRKGTVVSITAEDSVLVLHESLRQDFKVLRVVARVSEEEFFAQHVPGHVLIRCHSFTLRASVDPWRSPEQDESEEPWCPVPIIGGADEHGKEYELSFRLYLQEQTRGAIDEKLVPADATGSVSWVFCGDTNFEFVSTPGVQGVWDKFQSLLDVVEGVAIVDDAVDADLHNALVSAFEGLLNLQEEHVNGVVVDVLDPSLYPFILGTTRIRRNHREFCRALQEGKKKRDLWRRPYQKSAFQWLPSIFNISSDGKCSIDSYINNVPGDHAEAPLALSRLFERCLPLLRDCYAYICAAHDFNSTKNPWEDKYRYKPDLERASLHGRELKVITQMVEYRLEDGDTFNDQWHVQGTSHERIAMTCMYFLDRDEDLTGGDMLFKRQFFGWEGNDLWRGVEVEWVTMHSGVKATIECGMRPLGTLRARRGRLACVPNSHVCRLTALARAGACARTRAVQRVVLFHVLDPTVEPHEVVSTRDVRRQEGRLRADRARGFRERLRAERSVYQGDDASFAIFWSVE